MESDGMLRHIAFFEELAKLDESDASWRSVSAGLVTMRLVDHWLAGDYRDVAVDSWAVSAVRGAIEEISETTPLRRILAAIVDTMTSVSSVEVHTLCPRLIAYGQALEYDAKWSLASDVYQVVAQHADSQADADLVVTALIRLAVCHKNVGDLDAAAGSYNEASVVALAAGDMIGVLNARLGDATIAMARGNMPKAESILEETLEKAQSAGFDDIRSRALTHRAFIAGTGGRYDQAIRYSYDALGLSNNQRDRDRTLANIATGFRYLGLMDVARDAYLVLAATAQEQYIRWMSELNLMELAAQQGMELDFDKYRRDLSAADFSPQLRITYLLHVGRGYSALGHADAGIPYLERAVQIASNYSLNQLMFEAEEALVEARRREARPPVRTVDEVDASIHVVIDAIHGMKETAGIR
jgi:tetratricopeptide (TPR) repeat protein